MKDLQDKLKHASTTDSAARAALQQLLNDEAKRLTETEATTATATATVTTAIAAAAASSESASPLQSSATPNTDSKITVTIRDDKKAELTDHKATDAREGIRKAMAQFRHLDWLASTAGSANSAGAKQLRSLNCKNLTNADLTSWHGNKEGPFGLINQFKYHGCTYEHIVKQFGVQHYISSLFSAFISFRYLENARASLILHSIKKD